MKKFFKIHSDKTIQIAGTTPQTQGIRCNGLETNQITIDVLRHLETPITCELYKGAKKTDLIIQGIAKHELLLVSKRLYEAIRKFIAEQDQVVYPVDLIIEEKVFQYFLIGLNSDQSNDLINFKESEIYNVPFKFYAEQELKGNTEIKHPRLCVNTLEDLKDYESKLHESRSLFTKSISYKQDFDHHFFKSELLDSSAFFVSSFLKQKIEEEKYKGILFV